MVYNYWKLNYWLNPRPESLPTFLLIGLIVLGLILLGASYFGVKKLKNKPGEGAYGSWWKKIENFLATNGILAILWVFFSSQLIPYLSSRYWLVLWVAGGSYWLFWLCRKRQQIRKKIENIDKSSRVNQKYIP
ncbi:MAG: hypothetical protein PHW95_05680 [Patescibacteria group bacterium]|nr:hypothetical protein [Patescibacteria group bacterium]